MSDNSDMIIFYNYNFPQSKWMSSDVCGLSDQQVKTQMYLVCYHVWKKKKKIFTFEKLEPTSVIILT